LGNILSLEGKIILWNRHFNSHSVSPETEKYLTSFLDSRERPAFEKAIFRLNQYAPIADLKALARNRYMAWPYRLLLGLPVTLLTDVLLPGRVFPWGDYFNPFTNVAHLYSDDPAIALHEAGHAWDFSDFPYKGTYALLRSVPFMDLYQEQYATTEAINYLIEIKDRREELHAYKVLWPAYGTYIGAYVPLPLGSAIGAVVGHVFAWIKVHERKKFYKRMDAVLTGNSPSQIKKEDSTLLPTLRDASEVESLSQGPH